MSLLDANWYGLNSTRAFPLDDAATGRDDNGTFLPSDILVDAAIRFPSALGNYACLAAVTVTPGIVTVVLHAVTGVLRPTAALPAPAAPVLTPIASFSLAQPITPYISYAVEPLIPGVGGWLVFGPGIDTPYQGTFTTAAQAALLPRCATFYGTSPVTGLGRRFGLDPLPGLVKLAGGNDLSMSIQPRVINGTVVNAVVIGLNSNLTRDPYSFYAGPCSGRPESGTCAPPGITQINTTFPDSAGNINITWQDIQVYPLATKNGGVIISVPYQLADVCPPKALPNPVTGALPDTGNDDCVTPLPVATSMAAPMMMAAPVAPPPSFIAFTSTPTNMKVVSGLFSGGRTGYAAESTEALNQSVYTGPETATSFELILELPPLGHAAAGLLLDYQPNGDCLMVLVNSATNALELWSVVSGRQRISRATLPRAATGRMKLSIQLGRNADDITQVAATLTGSTTSALTWRGISRPGQFGVAALGGRALFHRLDWTS